jgi:hypothetical protein
VEADDRQQRRRQYRADEDFEVVGQAREGERLRVLALLRQDVRDRRLGIPPKQKERARQAFSTSANFAGYIAPNGRFSKPVAAKAPPLDDHDDGAADDDQGGGGGDGGGGGSDTPPPPVSARKPLEYELVDLLKDQAIGDEHREAIWTLVRFLAESKRSKVT